MFYEKVQKTDTTTTCANIKPGKLHHVALIANKLSDSFKTGFYVFKVIQIHISQIASQTSVLETH